MGSVNQATVRGNLTDVDLAAFGKLGISSGLLALARVERVDDATAREKFGIRFDGDGAGIAFPYYIDGRRVTCRVRRDNPERDAKGKPENKYISAYGDARHLYLPPDYERLLDDPRVPLLLVEAEKSVLAVTAWSQRTGRKLLAVGLGGCYGWRGKVGIKVNANGQREPEKGPLPEISFASAGRGCGILFDSNVQSNSDVQAARRALEAQLRKQGATVLVLNLPIVEGVNGPDDFIGACGDQAFGDLLDGKSANPDTAAVTQEADLQSQPLNDYGNGRRLIKLYGADLRYCTPMKRWVIWDGRRWKLDERDAVRKLAQETMLTLTRQGVVAGSNPMVRFAGRSLNTHRLTAMIREAQPHLAVDPDELDTDRYLLNFLNGTLDLQTGELREHSRDDLITKLVQYDYDPDAECPRFVTFIERTLGPLIPFVQKAIGYSLTGVTSEKVAFLCLGKTDTGKTTLLNLFRDLFQEYSTLILVDALMQREEDNNSRADLADLRGVRFAMTSETEEGQRLREGKLKRITQGQGKIKSVRKYENPITFNETHKLWLDCNHKPIIKGTDSAIWNRLSPIPFDRPLAPSEIDRELGAKLRQEAEGVIAWAVRGARLWITEGLGKPFEVESSRTVWRSEMDRLGAFREACCVEGQKLSVPARVLYQGYRKWAEEAGERPMTETMFGLRMTELGLEKDRDAGNRVIYIGIALRDLFNA